MNTLRFATVEMRNNHRRQAGSAMIEMALAFPLLVLLLAGTADFGRVFYTYVTLANAARTGAGYGSAGAPRTADSASIAATR